jgi:hypothetical protein
MHAVTSPWLELERRLTTLIAWLTVATGAAQIIAPNFLLPLLSVTPDPASAQLFATVGMFMVILGGAVLHAQRQVAALPVVLLWGGLQKLGASLFVAWAVYRHVFGPLSLGVASFDFLSGLIYFDLRRRGG